LGKTLILNATPNRTTPLSTSEIALAGAFSALPQTVLMSPIERVKVVVQVK